MAEQSNQAINADFSTAGASAGTILNMALDVMKNANTLQASQLHAYLTLLTASLSCTMNSAVTTVGLSGVGSAMTAGGGLADLVGGAAEVDYAKSLSDLKEKYHAPYDPTKPDGNGGIISELEYKYDAARRGGAGRMGADGPVEDFNIEKLKNELEDARNAYKLDIKSAKSECSARQSKMKGYSTMLQAFGQLFHTVGQSVGQVKSQEAQLLSQAAQQLAQVLNQVLQASTSMSQIDVGRANVAFASK